jgi:hypothetical protein
MEQKVSQRAYCSRQHPEEPLAGSAPSVDVWILLEYRPTWRARAETDNNLAPALSAWLEASLGALRSAGYRPRLQFIRQPELDRTETRLLVGARERLVAFSGEGYGFVRGLDLTAVAANPGRFDTLDEPRYFVCTNGQRDLCCARFGRQAYGALRERVGSRAWQITHLGGHRFAPNVLVLPDGLMYGRVDDTAVDAFVDRAEQGEIDFAHLRGRCRYPPHVQAAEIAAARSGLKLLHVDGDEQEALVTFGGKEATSRIRVRRRGEPLLVTKSCGEPEEPVYPYDAV